MIRKILLLLLITSSVIVSKGKLNADDNQISVFIVSTMFCDPCEALKDDLFENRTQLEGIKIYHLSLQLPFEQLKVTKAYTIWNKIASLDIWPLVYIADRDFRIRAKFRRKGDDKSILSRIVRIVESIRSESMDENEFSDPNIQFTENSQSNQPNEIGSFLNEISSLKNQLQNVKNSRQQLASRNESLQNRIVEFEELEEQWSNKTDSLNQIIESFSSNQDEYMTELDQTKNEKRNLEMQFNSLKDDYNTIIDQNEELESEISKLREASIKYHTVEVFLRNNLLKFPNMNLSSYNVDYHTGNQYFPGLGISYEFGNGFFMNFSAEFFLQDYFDPGVTTVKSEQFHFNGFYRYEFSSKFNLDFNLGLSFGRYNLSHDDPLDEKDLIAHNYLWMLSQQLQLNYIIADLVNIGLFVNNHFELDETEYFNKPNQNIDLKPDTISFGVTVGYIFIF